MTFVRSALAIVAGFWFVSATATVGAMLAARMFLPPGAPQRPLPASYVAAVLVATAAGSVMGGWLTARFAPHAPFLHACVLAAVSIALMVALAAEPDPVSHLSGYSLASALVSAAGVLAGGRLRAAAAAARGPVVA